MIQPSDIKEAFFLAISGEKPLLEFENWLYAHPELEQMLGLESYIDLISVGYRASSAKYDLDRLLLKHIDKGEYDTWILLRLLYKAKNRDMQLPRILMQFSDLYYTGYQFLYVLGMYYGLAVADASDTGNWDGLSTEAKEEILNSFYPKLEYELQQVIDWLEYGEIILTGVQADSFEYVYIDNRKDAVETPTVYEVIQPKAVRKPWWRFW